MIKIALSCSAVVIAIGVAFAQTAPQDPSSHGTLKHRAQDSEWLQTQQEAKLRLAQAVEISEGNGPGRAVQVGFKVDAGTTQYLVKVLAADGQLVEHHIDATSGQVLKSESHPLEAFFTRLKPSEVQNARTTLRHAIGVAEEMAGGKASEAAVKGSGNVIRYEITVVGGGRVRKVEVGANGQAAFAD